MRISFPISDQRYDVMCHACGCIALENATLTDACDFIESRGGHRTDLGENLIPEEQHVIAAWMPEEPCDCSNEQVPNHRLIVDTLLGGWRVSC